MPIRIIAIAAGLFAAFQLAGQSVNQSTFTLSESLIESLASQNAGEDDYEAILTDLEYLRKNPVDLNNCSREDLEKIPFLSDFQINSFLDYRKDKGSLLSVYELQVIHGFADDVIRMLIPFVTVNEKSRPGIIELKYAKNLRSEAILRFQRVIEKSKGYATYDPATDDMRYPGNPWLVNTRYGISAGDHFKAGVTFEKDPGEELFTGTNPAFDFNSAFAALNDIGMIKSLIVGDYRLALGQGLTMWTGAAPGKSSMPLSVVKRVDAVKPFTSNDENNFFRGAGASMQLGRIVLTAFISSKRKDANITDTLSSGQICFSSFQESGYHRTSSEITDEKSVRESVIGANLVYRNNKFKVGTTIAGYSFDKLMEAGDELKDMYDFSGDRLLNYGLDYSVVLKKVQLFGETSYGNNHMATLNGILFNTGKYASFSLVYRYFDPGYFSVHSSAFSESSNDCNEEGLYAGVVLHPASHVKISAYADFYRFPWLKYNLSKPSSGNDFLIQVDYDAGKKTEMYLRLKYEADPADSPGPYVIPQVEEMEQTGCRFHIRYRVKKELSMQNRLEWVRSENEDGILIYHDASLAMTKIPAEFDLRLSLFSTEGYSSRIYAYEQDITAGYSFSPLFDSGIRGYLMATCRLTPQIRASIRYSSTYYFNKNEIGSGYDEIGGHSKNDLKVRLAIIF